MFPALGFGAQLPPDWKVKCCGRCTFEMGLSRGQEQSCRGFPAGLSGEKLLGRGGMGGCRISAGGERAVECGWAARQGWSKGCLFLPAKLARKQKLPGINGQSRALIHFPGRKQEQSWAREKAPG